VLWLATAGCGDAQQPLAAVAADVTSEVPRASIEVVSTRPDMVSGGDVLVHVAARGDRAPSALTVRIDGEDAAATFRPAPAVDAEGRPVEAAAGAAAPAALLGLVTGLDEGAHTIEVLAGAAVVASREIVNHPVTGPLFSGPHQAPFVCQTAQNGLGEPADPMCSAPMQVAYVYRSTEAAAEESDGAEAVARLRDPARLPAGFKAFDPEAPRPADLATTTTSDGRAVDYIVRRERGTLNRAVYEIAFLHTPGEPLPSPWQGTPGWNGRLVYVFGGGCAAGYRQGVMRPILSDSLLSQGYAVAGSSLNVFGNTCNDVISAETALMVKERFIEQVGVPVHTIGAGGSGGSMQQYLIAQNYPGILDGLTPAVSFSDHLAVLASSADCALLSGTFSTLGAERFSDEQKRAISGFATWNVCGGSWTRSILQRSRCDAAVPEDARYDPEKRRDGARCTTHDNMVNMFGRDPATGFARRPLDNVGVQYGLAALRDGVITMDDFVELNAAIGGHDVDGNLVPQRTVADPEALRAAYRGRLNTGGGSLGSIPIIDSRAYADPTSDIHDSYRSFVTRERIAARNGGHADHFVILRTPPRPRNPDGSRARPPFDPVRLVDQWLTNLRADTSADDRRTKLLRARPAELADACFTSEDAKIVEPATAAGPGRCHELYPPFGDPRLAAGAPLRDDVLKCQLRPIDPADYPAPPTEAQLARLRESFPDGVCDYTRPGVLQEGEPELWASF
jgi:hypothetical protein